MAIMQGGDTWFWMWLAFSAHRCALSLATWYYTIVGRDRKITSSSAVGEETVERFGTIEEDRAPLPKFLIWTYIGLGTLGRRLRGLDGD